MLDIILQNTAIVIARPFHNMLEHKRPTTSSTERELERSVSQIKVFYQVHRLRQPHH